jgi:hypothetical protein
LRILRGSRSADQGSRGCGGQKTVKRRIFSKIFDFCFFFLKNERNAVMDVMYEQNQELMFVQGITGGTYGEILLGIARAHVVEIFFFFLGKKDY